VEHDPLLYEDAGEMVEYVAQALKQTSREATVLLSHRPWLHIRRAPEEPRSSIHNNHPIQKMIPSKRGYPLGLNPPFAANITNTPANYHLIAWSSSGKSHIGAPHGVLRIFCPYFIKEK